MVTKRTKTFLLRLSPEEQELFKQKARNYQSESAMVRDAVSKFDDRSTIGKLTALDELMTLLRKYQQQLGWLGGNFNQTVKRANQLIISNRLSQEYFDRILLPALDEVQALLQSIKDDQQKIYDKLIR